MGDKRRLWCKYCDKWWYRRGFIMHTTACEVKHRAANAVHQTGSASVKRKDTAVFIPKSPSAMSVDSAGADSTADEPQATPSSVPQEDICYFKYVYHPHGLLVDKIVPVAGMPAAPGNVPDRHPRISAALPWAPFQSYADFTFAEQATKTQKSQDDIDIELGYIRKLWSVGGSALSFRTHRDLNYALAAAQNLVVQFQHGSVSQDWRGRNISFGFDYRDPWEVILSLVKDPVLASVSEWHSYKKILFDNGTEEIWYDEPKSSLRCWQIESTLPDRDPYEHVYLPYIVWSDKGNVTKTTTVYPSLFRAGWIPEPIRNGSGNGGGVLIVHLPVVKHPDGLPEEKAAKDPEFRLFKMRVYQKVYAHVFATLQDPSFYGQTVRCGDGVTRVLHPGLFIESMDAEESAFFNACKAASAKFPCPSCLVRDDQLHLISRSFEQRTSARMKAIYSDAQKIAGKTAREAFLTEWGLKDVEQFLWDFHNSDPYLARSYDILHFDDIGKWGKHLWLIVKDAMKAGGHEDAMNQHLREFPRFRGLKHIQHATETTYADGNWYRDLLKCILPCIVQYLPKDDPLIHCIRAYTKYRMMAGLEGQTEARLATVKTFISAYEKCCKGVTAKYGKSFDFLKQHMTAHVVDDIRQTGSLSNKTTRINEAYIQEARAQYEKTNFKNAEHQMSEKDANMEAVAFIRMALNDRIAAAVLLDEDDDEDVEEKDTPRAWKFAAPSSGWLDAYTFEQSHRDNRFFQGFNSHLRAAISQSLGHLLSGHTFVEIKFYKCVHIYYQSQDDLRLGHDILHCSPEFHGHSRNDCVIFNDSEGDLAFARLHSLLRCRLSTKETIDMAAVTVFSDSKWHPHTVWDGCEVFDEESKLSLISLDDVFRGALMCPAYGSKRPQTHYLIDDVDGDMFLRLNGL